MICEICKKNNAVVHYTEVINDKIKKLNLCEECAANKGIIVQSPFAVGEFLGALTPPLSQHSAADKSLQCPTCGMTFADFKDSARFGCSQCYDTFQKHLLNMLSDIHKSAKHVGKAPKFAKDVQNAVSKIHELELKLQEAVNREEYETAAKIRDQIKAMDKKGKK